MSSALERLTRLRTLAASSIVGDDLKWLLAQYDLLVNVATPVAEALRQIGDESSWRDGDETDRVYAWHEIEPLWKALTGATRKPGCLRPVCAEEPGYCRRCSESGVDSQSTFKTSKTETQCRRYSWLPCPDIAADQCSICPKNTQRVSEDRLRNTRAWAEARTAMLSGAEVIVRAIDELLETREWAEKWHGLVEAIATILGVNSAMGLDELAIAIPDAIQKIQSRAHETEAPLLLEICALRGELELTVEHLEAANRACEEGSKTIDAYRRKYGTLTDEVEETKPCEHLRSELLAEKQVDGEPLFQMRKCLDCKLIFRVRSSLKSPGEHAPRGASTSTTSASTGETPPAPTSPVECPKCDLPDRIAKEPQ